MLLHVRQRFLGDQHRHALLRLLASPTLEWTRSASLGHTGIGRMWQLSDPSQHRVPEMVRLSTIIASAVYVEVECKLPHLLPAAEDVVPQVFPVRMRGDRADPPAQQPHCDHRNGAVPVVTSLYYADVQDVVGGALLLTDDCGVVRHQIDPVPDQLLVIEGKQRHAVEPVLAGMRTTIVVNFYRADQGSSRLL